VSPTYSQEERPLTVETPLGGDKLLLINFSGRESLSQLFEYHLDLMAPNLEDVAFDKLLGQKVSVTLELPGNKERYFNGIVKRCSQGGRDTNFTHYRMELVPQFWLLTKTAQSRIFQHKTVEDILKKVLEGLDTTWQIQGTFHPREYCVQYRETDFDFASRLMEEEGIYYYFEHTADGHKMVVANTPQSYADLVPGTLTYEEMTGGVRKEDRVGEWEKEQELQSGKVALWDHCFEMPTKHLEAERIVQDSVLVGTVTHKLKVAWTDKREIYDYPGGYAKRFDGITSSGGEQPSSLQNLFEDSPRTAAIRLQEQTTPSILIRGSSNCRQLVMGHKFTLKNHFNANGKYLLTYVAHEASLSSHYRSGAEGEFTYTNNFVCIPADIVFRPPRRTKKPRVEGSQTAVVVGPAGEEIFTDKYSRVKVQFHWDREGKDDANSSCWVRVATLWAGKQWGMIHIPRIGQEVVVDFLEGDPDCPIIVGSVYNADMMPPYTLPENRTQSGIKSRSSTHGGADNFNELRFEDKKGEEELFIHAEKDSKVETEHDRSEWVGHDRVDKVDHDETITIGNNRTEEVKKNEKITIGENQEESIGKDRTIKVGQNDVLDVKQKILIKAGQEITIETGASKIVMKADGTIQIQGVNIKIEGSATIENKGALITSEASGIHTIKGSLVKIN
jgi:type VI secretion system secreted protein VgrG